LLADYVTLSVRKMPLFLRLSGGSHIHLLSKWIYAARHFTVLKSTGSALENFVWDEYTTLVGWMIGSSARPWT